MAPSRRADETRPATLAFYLPQFHPTPENDAWWEPGFTEWHKVARAQPHHPGQRLPRLPGALGFYDLRLEETRLAQAALARAAGIDGFIYYHYWFDGRRLLTEPLDRMIESDAPQFPFCLCWANEPWTRRWDGVDAEILQPQFHSSHDDRRHMTWLVGVFADPRYIRLDGRPVLFVYRKHHLPDVADTIRTWREVCAELGEADPYLISFDTFDDDSDPRPEGFDAAAEFLPHGVTQLMPAAGFHPLVDDSGRGDTILRYSDVVDTMLARPTPGWTRYRCIMPNWDNTPRRSSGQAFLTVDSTPAAFADWARGAALDAERNRHEFLLINSWNEWAEGANLEPDDVDGTAYLDSLRSVLARWNDTPPAIDPIPIAAEARGGLPSRLESAARVAELEIVVNRRIVRFALWLVRRLRGS